MVVTVVALPDKLPVNDVAVTEPATMASADLSCVNLLDSVTDTDILI